MNLLHIIASMDPAQGGVSQGLRNTIPELEKLGVHNEVVSLDDKDSVFLGKDSFKIHPLSGRGPWKYSKELAVWLSNNLANYSVVIIHGLWLYPSYATSRAVYKYVNKKSSGTGKNDKHIRVYVMPHGMLDPYFQKAKGRKLKALRNLIYWKAFEARVVNDANGLLFTCEVEKELARQPFRPYKPKTEINVGFGIQRPPHYTIVMQTAFYEKCPEIKDEPYLLFLSRIDQKKGVDLLINAYLQMVSDNPTTYPKLVIAGPGLDTAYGKKIKSIVNTNKTLSGNVFFTGMISGNAKWGAFYGCEGFILTSHQENFGIAVVEALACAKPVLISDQVNIWKEIESEKAGIVSKDSLEGALFLLEKWLKTSPSEKLVLGKNAQSCFEKKFEIGQSACKLLNALR